MISICLSYAGLDREIATQVAVGLKGAGVEVWWDREGIGWGDNWIQTLEAVLTECGGYSHPRGLHRGATVGEVRTLSRHQAAY